MVQAGIWPPGRGNKKCQGTKQGQAWQVQGEAQRMVQLGVNCISNLEGENTNSYFLSTYHE